MIPTSDEIKRLEREFEEAKERLARASWIRAHKEWFYVGAVLVIWAGFVIFG